MEIEQPPNRLEEEQEEIDNLLGEISDEKRDLNDIQVIDLYNDLVTVELLRGMETNISYEGISPCQTSKGVTKKQRRLSKNEMKQRLLFSYEKMNDETASGKVSKEHCQKAIQVFNFILRNTILHNTLFEILCFYRSQIILLHKILPNGYKSDVIGCLFGSNRGTVSTQKTRQSLEEAKSLKTVGRQF